MTASDAIREDRLDARIGDLARARFGTSTSLRRLEALAGDASTRRYARVWLEGAGAPPTVVVMVLADRGVAMSSDELAVFADPPVDLPYVNVHHFLASLGVAVPELYIDASDTGVLVLEDVGDVALWDAVQGRSEEEVEQLFQRAIDQLLRIQVLGTARRDDRCIAFQQAFDARLFEWELNHFLEHGLVGRIGRPLPQREQSVLRRHFDTLVSFLDQQPRVLSHRDFHAWNLFVQRGRIRVLDFQDALLAPAPYDLATLLGDRVTPAVIRPPLERRLREYYAKAWEACGAEAWSGEELEEAYAVCALQKALKVVGRFYFLDREKGKSGYLRYIPPTLRQIARLLAARPDLAEMSQILGQYFPELRP